MRKAAGIVRLVDVAPEQPGGLDFVEKASQLCTVSIAHTTADYDQAKAAFDKGVTHATHLFNAMSGLHHRKPGVVGAVFRRQPCPGRADLRRLPHPPGGAAGPPSGCWGTGRLSSATPCGPTACRRARPSTWAARWSPSTRARRCCPTATIAGSVTNLHQEIKNLVSFGVPFEQAVKAATLLPARAIGLDGEIGSIAPGKRADLVVLDENLDIAAVYH